MGVGEDPAALPIVMLPLADPVDIAESVAVDTIALAEELEFPIEVAAASKVVVVSEQERTRSLASSRVSTRAK